MCSVAFPWWLRGASAATADFGVLREERRRRAQARLQQGPGQSYFRTDNGTQVRLEGCAKKTPAVAGVIEGQLAATAALAQVVVCIP